MNRLSNRGQRTRQILGEGFIVEENWSGGRGLVTEVAELGMEGRTCHRFPQKWKFNE